jgi:hypothetical protein
VQRRPSRGGLAEEGVAEEGVAEEGVAEEGVAEEGVAEEGVAEEGVAEEGVAIARKIAAGCGPSLHVSLRVGSCRGARG